MIADNFNKFPSSRRKFRKLISSLYQILVMPLGACIIYSIISLFDHKQPAGIHLWLLVVLLCGIVLSLALNNKTGKGTLE